MMKRFAIATAACATLLIAANAKADVYTYTNESDYLTNGTQGTTGTVSDQVNWGLFDAQLGQPSENGNIPDNQQLPTPGSDLVTTASGDGGSFTTFVEGGPNWQGNFSNGTTILYTSDGTITIKFATPLVGLGLHAQIEDNAGYIETLTAYNSLNQSLGMVSNSGASAGTGPNGVGSAEGTGGTGAEGTAPFVGISTNAQNNASSLATLGISYVTIQVNQDFGDGFAIDTSLLFHYAIGQAAPPAPTPEPGTLGLLGVGLAGLGLIRRRRKV